MRRGAPLLAIRVTLAALEFVASRFSDGEVTEFNNIARDESATPVTRLEVQHWRTRVGGAEMSELNRRVSTPTATNRVSARTECVSPLHPSSINVSSLLRLRSANVRGTCSGARDHGLRCSAAAAVASTAWRTSWVAGAGWDTPALRGIHGDVPDGMVGRSEVRHRVTLIRR